MSSLSCASSARVGVALGSKRAIRGSARVARASARASKRASKRVNLTTRAVKEVAGAEFKAEVLEVRDDATRDGRTIAPRRPVQSPSPRRHSRSTK